MRASAARPGRRRARGGGGSRRPAGGPGGAVVALEDVTNEGSRGAPWPPAATSRRRKSATVVRPVASAITFGSPNCCENGAAPSGSCRSVCPCDPIATTRECSTPAASSVFRAASANAWPSRVSSRPTSSSVTRASACESRSTSAARSPGIGHVRANSTRGCGSNATSAASMPSTLVPEIRPRKSPPGSPAGSGCDGRVGAMAQRDARRMPSTTFSCAIAGAVATRKAASSAPTSGSGLGIVTVSGSRCAPLTRNS